MKKLLLLPFIFLSLIFGCSKDFIEEKPKEEITGPSNPSDTDTTSLEYFYENHCYGYKVKDTTALTIMGINQNKPYTNFDVQEGTVFLSGTRNGKLWIAGFDYESKEQNFEFVDNKPMELKYKLHVGYGEYKDITISGTQVEYILTNSPNTLSRVQVYDRSSYSTSSAAYVTFTTPSSSKTYLTQANCCTPIAWYNNTYLIYGLNINNPYDSNIYSCINQEGDTLFTQKNDRFFAVGRVFPINYKEVIFFDSFYIFNSSLNENQPAIVISRENIDYPYKDSIWRISMPIHKDYWVSDAKHSITKKEISDTIWQFTVDLVWYSGEKESYNYTINIQTGEVINKD